MPKRAINTTPKRRPRAVRPRSKPKKAAPGPSYWESRVASPEFRTALVGALATEFDSLTSLKVRDVVDATAIQRLITERGPQLVNRKAVADLVVHINGLVTGRLAEKDTSAGELLGNKLTKRIEGILDEDLVVSDAMEDFIREMMGQEFIQGLFTDIIYTAIVSFNQRVNPLFGRMTMLALEGQIKGFIRFFMPMVQSQAVSFATSKTNQTILFDFTRAIVRHVLQQPLSDFVSTMSPRQRKKAEALVRQAVGEESLDTLVRDTAAAVWDGLYARIADRKIGDLVRLDRGATWLAERLAEALLPAFSRPHLLRFASDEITRAAGAAS